MAARSAAVRGAAAVSTLAQQVQYVGMQGSGMHELAAARPRGFCWLSAATVKGPKRGHGDAESARARMHAHACARQLLPSALCRRRQDQTEAEKGTGTAHRVICSAAAWQLPRALHEDPLEHQVGGHRQHGGVICSCSRASRAGRGALRLVVRRAGCRPPRSGRGSRRRAQTGR